MKDFIRPRGRLRALPLPARLVYSVFLVFTLAGLALSAVLADAMVGLSLEGLERYYAGIEHSIAPPAQAAQDDGPMLALPTDLDDVPEPQPMSVHRLLEVTHFHLFSMPVYLMVLCHLFMLSRMRDRPKLAWIAAASVSTALHMAAPWVARSAHELATPVYAGTGLGLALTYGVMCLVPLWEMWAPAS